MNSSLPLAFLIGAAFGACLEASGLGRADKLAGQFSLRDFTVLKVMFSAIVTAMLGSFWLGRLGMLDLAALYVPPTFAAAQIVGGLLFGVGFVLAGLCPGTACVAAAGGRVDGLAAMCGLLVGVLSGGWAMPSLAWLYADQASPASTLPAALGLPYGVVVAAVTVIAVGLFAFIERREPRV